MSFEVAAFTGTYASGTRACVASVKNPKHELFDVLDAGHLWGFHTECCLPFNIKDVVKAHDKLNLIADASKEDLSREISFLDETSKALLKHMEIDCCEIVFG